MNPFGIGVGVTASTNEERQFQEMTLTRGFQSSVAPQLHFGFGTRKMVDTLTVRWPDGKEQLLTNVAVNQKLTLDPSNAIAIPQQAMPKRVTLFETVTNSEMAVDFRHEENYYNDFIKEILLPHQTSMFGPGLGVGDLNGDSLDDFIVGGAANHQAGIYFQTNNGFEKDRSNPSIARDSIYEDLGILVFDAEADGDNDIYMVSGGNEFSPDSKLLQDRLYLNDGAELYKGTGRSHKCILVVRA